MKVWYHDDSDGGYSYFGMFAGAVVSATALASEEGGSVTIIGMEVDVTAKNLLNALNDGGYAKRHWDAAVVHSDGTVERIKN